MLAQFRSEDRVETCPFSYGGVQDIVLTKIDNSQNLKKEEVEEILNDLVKENAQCALQINQSSRVGFESDMPDDENDDRCYMHYDLEGDGHLLGGEITINIPFPGTSNHSGYTVPIKVLRVDEDYGKDPEVILEANDNVLDNTFYVTADFGTKCIDMRDDGTKYFLRVNIPIDLEIGFAWMRIILFTKEIYLSPAALEVIDSPETKKEKEK